MAWVSPETISSINANIIKKRWRCYIVHTTFKPITYIHTIYNTPHRKTKYLVYQSNGRCMLTWKEKCKQGYLQFFTYEHTFWSCSNLRKYNLVDVGLCSLYSRVSLHGLQDFQHFSSAYCFFFYFLLFLHSLQQAYMDLWRASPRKLNWQLVGLDMCLCSSKKPSQKERQ